MRIKPEDEYNYLMSKSAFYAAGWNICNLGGDALSTRKLIQANIKHQEEFDQGYSDCYANGESAPETFDYVKGI